jgi:hypothetical protein
MKKFLFIIFFILTSYIFCTEQEGEQLKKKPLNNDYILKIIPISKVEIITFGKKYYNIYNYYEDSINKEVANYTIPDSLKDYVFFNFEIKKNPILKYSFKYKFNGIYIDYKYLKLDKTFQFFSNFVY